MAERAVWRVHPNDPKSVVGWVLADRDRFLALFREHLGCGWLILLLVFAWRFELGMVAALLALQIAARTLLRPKVLPIDDLLTLPPPELPFPCDVEVMNGAAHLGFDRGIVTFVDGWLIFEGRRTSLSISRNDVRQRDQNKLFLDDVAVCFSPDDRIDSAGYRNSGLKPRFEKKLDDWYRIERSIQGQSVLPPRRIHMSGRVRTVEDLVYGTILVAISIGISIWLSVNVFVVAIIFGSFGSLKKAIDADWDMRKFQRLENALSGADSKSLGRIEGSN